MDDLNDNPQEVAEDIIKQATSSGFKQAATDRMISILTFCQELQQEIVELKKQKETETVTETNITYEGGLAWRNDGNKEKGPYCARCHINNKELIRMIDLSHGLWECPKCNRRWRDPSSLPRQQESY